MSMNTDELIDAVLASGCEFDVAQNISDHNEVKKILQQCDTAWIVLPKGFPWNIGVMNDYEVSRSAISIEKIDGARNWGEWHISGMYSDVLKHKDFTLELVADYDELVADYDIRGMYSDVLKHKDFTLELVADYDELVADYNIRHSDKIPENGIELKATLTRLLEKVRKASKELNTARIRSCIEEFEV